MARALKAKAGKKNYMSDEAFGELRGLLKTPLPTSEASSAISE